MTQHLTIAGLDVLIDGPDASDGPDGDAAHAPCVVMLHGWPDTAALWQNTVAALSPHYRCVRFTWPGFAPGDVARLYSLDELTQSLHAVVQQVNGGRPVTLLVHDWGCLFGYHYATQQPQNVARVAGLDIGDAGSRAHAASLSLKQKFMAVGYQLWLALAWKLGGALSQALGDRMARSMAKAMRVPLAPQAIHAAMCYPYWLAWTGGFRAVRAFKPKVPMFFAYGERKPFMFHSVAWRDALAAMPDNQVHGYRAGHWLMLDVAPLFHADLLAWLRRTDAPGPPA